MRIISKFHDYYDSVLAQGQDTNLVYLRKQKEVEYKWTDYPFPVIRYLRYFKKRWLHGPTFNQTIVGFCGKIYPVLIFRGNCACFTIEDVDAYITSHFKSKCLEEYKLKDIYYRYKYYPPSLRRVIFEKYFLDCKSKQNDFESLFIESKCPIFLGSNCGRNDNYFITYNGCLKDVQFFRLFDPFTAFQEISMYVGNIAQPNKSIPKVSDGDLAKAKGFDEWSFRKEKI